MRATLMYAAGDVRIENVPDAHLNDPTDALVRVRRAAICGSDLWPYKSMEPSETGRRMGHELVGVIEDVGADVEKFKAGDLVVSPFLISDGTCVFLSPWASQLVRQRRQVRLRRCRRRSGRSGSLAPRRRHSRRLA
jgi:threonine dehydrogenase-like Zn-dependent dehydrogenase